MKEKAAISGCHVYRSNVAQLSLFHNHCKLPNTDAWNLPRIAKWDSPAVGPRCGCVVKILHGLF